MYPRWHLLILLPMLLLSNLSARAECVMRVPPALVSVGCQQKNVCVAPDYAYAYYVRPPNDLTEYNGFAIDCTSDNEYVTLTLDLGGTIDPNTSWLVQKIDFYGFDGQMDYIFMNTGDFKGKSVVSFNLYGSTSYLFKFHNQTWFKSLSVSSSQLPNCSVNFGEKILKADNSNSAMYQCSLFVETVNNPPHSGLGGCIPHRCQYYPDRKLVTFCNLKYNDEDCYLKAEHVWMIGTEYDLSSLPKVMIYLTMLIIYFLGYIAGFLVLSGV